MPREQMRDLLVQVLEHYPSMVLDLDEPPERGPGGYHPPPGNAPDWCVCGNCRQMPTQLERVCCDKRHEHCIAMMPDFNVLILDEAVLALARMYRRDLLVVNDDADHMKANRHAGYR